MVPSPVTAIKDELTRSKRDLDKKFFEAGKLRDESIAWGD